MENLILLASESQFAAAVCQEYSLFIVPIKIFVHGPFPVPIHIATISHKDTIWSTILLFLLASTQHVLVLTVKDSNIKV
jgi:hypothetical protein